MILVNFVITSIAIGTKAVLFYSRIDVVVRVLVANCVAVGNNFFISNTTK